MVPAKNNDFGTISIGCPQGLLPDTPFLCELAVVSLAGKYRNRYQILALGSASSFISIGNFVPAQACLLFSHPPHRHTQTMASQCPTIVRSYSCPIVTSTRGRPRIVDPIDGSMQYPKQDCDRQVPEEDWSLSRIACSRRFIYSAFVSGRAKKGRHHSRTIIAHGEQDYISDVQA